uniref:Uncharacterized protein n=1 Tax=Fusarium oxysporum (strain Fo5176) TaxID=660025 RepID=A0A0D2Y1T5_FUSOF
MSHPNDNSDVMAGTGVLMISEPTDPGAFNNAATLWRAALPSRDVSSTISTQTDEYFCLSSVPPTSGRSEDKSPFKVFGKIMQPPAAMLMGGIKKWRHLQQYLVNLASRNDAVISSKMDGWLAAIFLLAWIQVLRDRVEHDKRTRLAMTKTSNYYLRLRCRECLNMGIAASSSLQGVHVM